MRIIRLFVNLCSCTLEHKIQTRCARDNNSEATKNKCVGTFAIGVRLVKTIFLWNGVYATISQNGYSCDFAFCTHIPPRVHRVVVFVLPCCCSTGGHRRAHLKNRTARWWPWLDSNGVALFVQQYDRGTCCRQQRQQYELLLQTINNLYSVCRWLPVSQVCDHRGRVLLARVTNQRGRWVCWMQTSTKNGLM